VTVFVPVPEVLEAVNVCVKVVAAATLIVTSPVAALKLTPLLAVSMLNVVVPEPPLAVTVS
jgi:hypothetical protein